MRCDPAPQPNEPAGCTGARNNSFADGQITFVPDVARCTAGTLAEGLAASNAALASTSKLAIPPTLSGVSLQGRADSKSHHGLG